MIHIYKYPIERDLDKEIPHQIDSAGWFLFAESTSDCCLVYKFVIQKVFPERVEFNLRSLESYLKAR